MWTLGNNEIIYQILPLRTTIVFLNNRLFVYIVHYIKSLRLYTMMLLVSLGCHVRQRSNALPDYFPS